MIEELLDRTSLKTLILAFIAIYALIKVSQRITAERKIRALGGRAVRVKTWIPGGPYLSTSLIVPIPADV
jgi:hypothetical protein